MIPFRTENGAAFRCKVDPSWTTFANLNFYAERSEAGYDRIPFHVSLRLTDGLIVVNHKGASGWHREEHIPYRFSDDRFQVDLVFAPRQVTLTVDGIRIGQFRSGPRLDTRSRFLLQRGYSGLNQIVFCAAEGAVPWETIETHDKTFDRLWESLPSKPGLVLTDRLELAEFLPSDQTAARHGLILPGQDTAVPLCPATTPPGPMPNTFTLPKGIAAVLVPGRIWIGTEGDQPATLRIVNLQTGGELPPLSLSRAEVAQRLARLTRDGGLAHDDIAALQAIEHVRHGALWPHLSDSVRDAVISAAARLGLSAFLNAPQSAVAPPKIERPPVAQGVAEVTADLARLLVTSPDRSALQAWLEQTLSQRSDSEMENLALALCPSFCEENAFDLLFAALQARPALTIRPWDEVGYVSVTLPFQLMAGDFDSVINRMTWLSQRHGGWLATSAIGWIARTLATPGTLPAPEANRLGILQAFCAIVAAQAKDPWGRAPCHCLMAGTLALLENLPRLPPDLRTTVTETALSAYGLSPRFWELLADAVPTRTLSAFAPDLLAAQRAFADLATPSQLGQALATLAALNCQGTASAALCLAPAEHLRQIAPWHSDLLLRDLFRPGNTQDPDFDVRSAIARSQPMTGRGHRASPFEGLERHLGETAFTLLTDWPNQPEEPRFRALQACLSDAMALCRPEAGYVGLAVSLSCLAALGDDPAARALILSHLHCARHIMAPPASALADAPALRPALQALAADQTLCRSVETALDLPPTPAQTPLVAARALPPATALFRTVVVVLSCHPNLQTRIPAMRKSWLSDLTRLGIPYVVVVGQGPSTTPTDPDIVTLNAPDDYEGLPQKSLAAFEHVQHHFPGYRMFKVDDDCFVDVEEFFFSLSFLKADYYGRPLARARGQMDRTWHMDKSTSLRGRSELDKSPEPSTYADGGSGYLLSALALQSLVATAKTAEGQRLIQASFMEDKLVGDLLALSGITALGTDYRVHVLRRSRPGGTLVPKWENASLPFRGSGVKLAHLDGHDLQATAALAAKTRRPASGKIWSTLAPARLGAQSNALDLISSPDRLDNAMRAAVSVVACLRNEMFMLPAFLAHYRALGVDSFLIADNGSDDGTLEYLAEQPDVALFSVDSDYGQSHYGVMWQQALMAAYRPDRWSLLADADELLVWSATATGNLPALLATPDFADCDAAPIFMLDMYPQGKLSDTRFDTLTPFEAAPFTDRAPFLTTSLGRGPFSDSRTWTSATRHRLLPGSRAELFVAQKIALLRYRPWMRLSDGLHYVAETKLSPRALLFGHFKYNAAFRAKATSEVARGQHFNNAEEYRKYLDLIAEGRETLYDPAVSVRWTDSAFVRSILTSGKPLA
jgi:hypothetical protein